IRSDLRPDEPDNGPDVDLQRGLLLLVEFSAGDTTVYPGAAAHGPEQRAARCHPRGRRAVRRSARDPRARGVGARQLCVRASLVSLEIIGKIPTPKSRVPNPKFESPIPNPETRIPRLLPSTLSPQLSAYGCLLAPP